MVNIKHISLSSETG